MNQSLLKKKCIPCEGDETMILRRGQFEPFLKDLPEWSVIDDRKIEKIFKFNTFSDAIKFINKVAEVAEANNHHPDMLLFGWNKVKLTLSTHAVDALTENDFIIATQTDAIDIKK